MGKSEYQKVFDAKKKSKELLYKKCWPRDLLSKPLVVVFAPEKNEAILFQLLEGCFVLNCNLIVISEKEPPDALKHPSGKMTWFNPENGRNQPVINEFLDAADMAVVFEEHKNEMHELFKKGVVLIGNEKSPFLQNYHPNEETGNSFTYDSLNPWSIFMALVRAQETFRFPYDWQNIIRGILKMARKS
jgi:hypothetical protein